jgi:predicted thioesterase
MIPDLQPGATLEFSYVVSDSDCAHRLAIEPDDAFPEVFATNRMVALLEVCAARLMRAALPDDHLSVGVDVDICHLAATLPGSQVTLRATFLQRTRGLYEFEVQASDVRGLIGEGRHTRAVVRATDFMERAQKRHAGQRAPSVQPGFPA